MLLNHKSSNEGKSGLSDQAMNFLKLLPTGLLDTFLRVKFKSYLPLVVVVVDVVVVIVEVVVVAAIILKIKSIMFFICLYQLSFDILLCLIPLLSFATSGNRTHR